MIHIFHLSHFDWQFTQEQRCSQHLQTSEGENYFTALWQHCILCWKKKKKSFLVIFEWNVPLHSGKSTHQNIFLHFRESASTSPAASPTPSPAIRSTGTPPHPSTRCPTVTSAVPQTTATSSSCPPPRLPGCLLFHPFTPRPPPPSRSTPSIPTPVRFLRPRPQPDLCHPRRRVEPLLHPARLHGPTTRPADDDGGPASWGGGRRSYTQDGNN